MLSASHGAGRVNICVVGGVERRPEQRVGTRALAVGGALARGLREGWIAAAGARLNRAAGLRATTRLGLAAKATAHACGAAHCDASRTVRAARAVNLANVLVAGVPAAKRGAAVLGAETAVALLANGIVGAVAVSAALATDVGRAAGGALFAHDADDGSGGQLVIQPAEGTRIAAAVEKVPHSTGGAVSAALGGGVVAHAPALCGARGAGSRSAGAAIGGTEIHCGTLLAQRKVADAALGGRVDAGVAAVDET